MTPVLIVHGGAGESRLQAPAEMYHHSLRQALQAGTTILQSGGTAVDAVMQAVIVLEDDALFNAGRGAVLNARGECELDAAIMCGHSGRAGAVAAVSGVKNPVRAARAVLENEKNVHVLLCATGAAEFSRAQDLEFRDPNYFITEHRQQSWQRWRETGNPGETPLGTVGAVALDQHGHLAAATSTGGTTGKAPGRIGDSPLIGAGTFANQHCAISCTGDGEFFMRQILAGDVAARIRYAGANLAGSAEASLQSLTDAGGTGGLIAVDAQGHITTPYNCKFMFRGLSQDGHRWTALDQQQTMY